MSGDLRARWSPIHKEDAVKNQEDVATRKERKNRRPWEAMRLIPVGSLGVVIQDMMGSVTDGATMGDTQQMGA
jgi:hypothetical protein